MLLEAGSDISPQDKASMVKLMHVVDRASGYIFVPAPNNSENPAPPGAINAEASAARRPNTYALFSSALGTVSTPGTDIRDVQERWIDEKERYDAFEKVEWRREGEAVRAQAAKTEQAR
jgi:GPN-loop GTPase